MTRDQRPRPRPRPSSGRSTRNLWLVGIALVVLAVVGVLAFLSRGTGAQPASFGQLVVGNCVDLPLTAATPAPPTSSPVPVEPGNTPTPGPSATPAPSADAATVAVLAGQASRVSCSGRHTHEVVGTTGIEIGDVYQGRAFLLDIAHPACSSAFAEYVGHDVDGSALALTIVVPDEDHWARKERRAVCLASRADGTATNRSLKGSGL